MSYYLGPYAQRWTPSSWQDVVDAAAGGVLDETHWVELKAALPPGIPKANLELARDLASLAVDGGILVVGIKDDHGRAGAVVGTQLAGLGDRVDQVSRDVVTPPLVVRPVELADPDRPGMGCLLIVVDASSEAPHMVDERYWGRGATGKRVLTDVEVRKTFELNQRRLASAGEALQHFVELNPLNSAGCLFVVAAPRSSRSGALADRIDDQMWVYDLIHKAGGDDPHGWWLTDERIHRTIDGIDVCHGEPGQFADHPADDTGLTVRLLRIGDDGAVWLAVNGLVGADERGSSRRVVWIEGVQVLTRAAVSLAGLLAHAAGYAGLWDIGAAITDLRGAVRGTRSELTYGSRRSYPNEQYTRLAQSTSADLAEHPETVVDELLSPLRRVLT